MDMYYATTTALVLTSLVCVPTLGQGDCFAPSPCDDLDGNGVVDGADFGSMLGAFGTEDPELDLDGDGTVGGADVGLLLGSWGICP